MLAEPEVHGDQPGSAMNTIITLASVISMGSAALPAVAPADEARVSLGGEFV